MGCGDIRFLEGGTINGATVVNSQVVNSNIVTCEISASHLTKCDIDESKMTASNIEYSSIKNSDLTESRIVDLQAIDAPSAQTIADAIAVLPKEDLVKLSSALFSALKIPVAEQPADSASDATLSTVVFGGGDATLGAPAQWGQFGEFVVPMYKPGDTSEGD